MFLRSSKDSERERESGREGEKKREGGRENGREEKKERRGKGGREKEREGDRLPHSHTLSESGSDTLSQLGEDPTLLYTLLYSTLDQKNKKC